MEKNPKTSFDFSATLKTSLFNPVQDKASKYHDLRASSRNKRKQNSAYSINSLNSV